MDSTRLKCIIVDDEPSAIRILRGFAEKSNLLQVIETFRNPIDVISFLNSNEIDLMFLDINMPELNGIDLLRSLNNPPMVILTTAYSEYALESYDYGVVDYLLKPIPFPRFLKAVNKVQTLNKKSSEVSPKSAKLTLKDGSKIYNFAADDILYIEAYGNYLKIITSLQRIVIKSGLQEFLTQHDFLGLIRVHKSYAVSLIKVTEVSHNKVKIESHQVPIGRKYRSSFVEALKR